MYYGLCLRLWTALWLVFRFVERLLVFGFGLVVCFVVRGLVVHYGFGFLGFGLRVFVKELLVCRY